MALRPKILLLEHNVFIAQVMEEKLSAQGFMVAIAKRRPLLELLQRENPAVVVVDFDNIDFVTFVNEVSALTGKIAVSPKILILSKSDVSPEMEEHYPSLFQNKFLLNGWNPDDLVAKVLSLFTSEEIADIAESYKQAVESGEVAPEDGGGVNGSQGPIAIRQAVSDLSLTSTKEGSISEMLDNLVEYAYLLRASDIHLDTEEGEMIVRLRLNGVLTDIFSFDKELLAVIIGRIKVLSGMRTDEHQTAQDGRFRTDVKTVHQTFDVRVSILPSYHGECAVLRLLIEQVNIHSVTDLPMSDVDKKKVITAMKKANGMVLATGPTGSGKTTTLYTILKDLNTRDLSIITVEDPVEYAIRGLKQIQINAAVDLTFANALRSILRQDPDIIMVGEIRDRETAGIAVNAALTGHRMFSTLHTNDAASTLPRLSDMGIEPYLIASTVRIIIAQRLVRTICPFCRTEKTLTDVEAESLKDVIPSESLSNNRTFYYGTGCGKCDNTGFSARTGIYEVLEMTDPIREAIMKQQDASSIKKLAIQEGMVTLIQDGFQKAQFGVTTIEEVLRVLRD